MIFALEEALGVDDVEVPHQLHGQRRGALGHFAFFEVLDHRPEASGVIDAVVLVEALVLDRDGRVLDVLRHVLQLDRSADLVRVDQAQLAAVTGDDHQF
jgi:hypothetical protein